MTFLYILIAVLVIFLILLLAAPKKYDVHRSIQIKAPLAEIFTYLKHVKNQDHWSPWKKRDPNMKQTDTGVDGTIGFITKWESDHKQVGSGEQELKKIVENERIETEIRFLKPWKSVSTGYFTVSKIDHETTNVMWGFHGTHKLPANLFAMFFNMDKAVGKDFDEGLADLKKLLEKN